MKNNKLFICLLFVLGFIQLKGQIGSIDLGDSDLKRPCVSFVLTEQTCNDNGTVSVAFLISNNTRCNARAITIIPPNGLGQSYNVPISGQTVSNVPFTFNGLTPGSLACFDVVLHGGDGLIGKKGRECCRAEVCIDVIECCNEPPCCDLDAVLEEVQGCDPNNQSARITLSGGTPEYSGPPNSFPVGVPTNWIVPGLSPGSYVFTFSDENGCEVDVPVVVTAPDCDQFDFTLIESSPSVTEIKSKVSATITVSMNAWCIPDMIEVFVDDELVLELVAGSGGCNDMDPVYGVSGSFCVEPCQDVRFVTTGNICPGEYDCDGNSTAFDISISCALKGGGNGGSRSSNSINNGTTVNREKIINEEAMRLKAQESLMVYPNPVTNELNIASSDPMIEYQTVRILSSTGQVLHIQDLSNLNQVRIETSRLPEGVYFLEIIDTNGIEVLEKFIKLD